jgi:hypothetical protein
VGSHLDLMRRQCQFQMHSANLVELYLLLQLRNKQALSLKQVLSLCPCHWRRLLARRPVERQMPQRRKMFCATVLGHSKGVSAAPCGMCVTARAGAASVSGAKEAGSAASGPPSTSNRGSEPNAKPLPGHLLSPRSTPAVGDESRQVKRPCRRHRGVSRPWCSCCAYARLTVSVRARHQVAQR